MRYPASEKLEIIRIVEQSHLPAKRTLDQLGIARRTFYGWYDRYREGGPEALEDRRLTPSRRSRRGVRMRCSSTSKIFLPGEWCGRRLRSRSPAGPAAR